MGFMDNVDQNVKNDLTLYFDLILGRNLNYLGRNLNYLVPYS